MSKQSINIKPNNHRIHPCPVERKLALLSEITSRNSEMNIIIVSSSSNDMLKENIIADNVSVLSDKELYKNKDLTCDFLISYDLPDAAIIYMARVAKATQMAIILLDANEHKKLYPIETLLGRTIKQEIINGYEPAIVEKKEYDPTAPRKMTKEQIKEVAKKRYDEKTGNVEKKSYDRPKEGFKKDFKKSDKSETPDQWKKKKKAPNKFLGKDKNGKALFSGKSGDRNHRYDGTPNERYNAPKKVGKTIKIKARNKSEE